MAVYDGGWRSTEICRGRLRIRRSQIRVLPSAPTKALQKGEKVGNNPTERGKLGAKTNLLVNERGAPLSVMLTGANRHEAPDIGALFLALPHLSTPLREVRALRQPARAY
jgi:hypothetical protein